MAQGGNSWSKRRAGAEKIPCGLPTVLTRRGPKAEVHSFSDLRVPRKCPDSVTGPRWQTKDTIVRNTTSHRRRWDVCLDLKMRHRCRQWDHGHALGDLPGCEAAET